MGEILGQGIDISKWQGNLDLTKDIDFAILRIGYGRGSKDPKFERFYEQTRKLKIPTGCYFYSYDKTIDDAKEGAKSLLGLLRGKQFELPVFLDIEEKSQFSQGRDFINSLIHTYGDMLESNNYAFGYYMSTSPANAYVSRETNLRYAYWAAQYGMHAKTHHRVDIWQHTSKHPYHGMLVDHNFLYTDFSWIQGKGFNNYE